MRSVNCSSPVSHNKKNNVYVHLPVKTSIHINIFNNRQIQQISRPRLNPYPLHNGEQK